MPGSPSISDAAVCPAADAHVSHVARRTASGAPPTPKRSMPESWIPSMGGPFTSSKTKRYVEPIGVLGGDGGDSGVPTGTLGGGGGGGDGSGGGGDGGDGGWIDMKPPSHFVSAA